MYVDQLKKSVENIDDEWADLPLFENGQFDTVCDKLAKDTKEILPAPDKVLRVFRLVKQCCARVVILGQDPYPN